MNLRNIELNKLNNIEIKYKTKKIYTGWVLSTIHFRPYLKNKYTEYEKENMLMTNNSMQLLKETYKDINDYEKAEFIRIINNMYILIKIKKYNKFTTYCLNDWNEQ